MAQILEISQAEWETVPGPSNVLVIPSQGGQPTAPIGPIVPQDGSTAAFQYRSQNCGPNTACTLLFHDANSGWWSPQQSIPCTGQTDKDGIFLTAEQWFQKLVNEGIDPTTNQPFTPFCLLDFISWPKPPGWTSCSWDYWTIVCDNYVVFFIIKTPTVPPNLFCLPPGQTQCPPGQAMNNPEFPQCCFPIPTPPPTSPFWCQPPGVVTVLSNGATVCMFDPPIPNHLPLALRGGTLRGAGALGVVSHREREIRAREGREIARAELEFSSAFLALDPTRRMPVPFVMKSCGCDDDDFIDEIIGA